MVTIALVRGCIYVQIHRVIHSFCEQFELLRINNDLALKDKKSGELKRKNEPQKTH